MLILGIREVFNKNQEVCSNVDLMKTDKQQYINSFNFLFEYLFSFYSHFNLCIII